MRKHIFILLIFLVIGFTGCQDAWNEHYGLKTETVDQNVWDAIQTDSDLSQFVQFVKDYQLDTLFAYNDVFTLFVPTNEAMSDYLLGDTIGKSVIAYHILKYFINPVNISGIRKVQTLMLKFAQFENTDDLYSYDDIPVSFTSPMYTNGRYFIIDGVAKPKPSLYEYISANNQALKKYIDSQDSIALDKELSVAIGFDEDGNTIYDSVITVINLFEEEYFKVSEEFRVKSATLVFPKQDLYNTALTNMALKLGGTYSTYNDIAADWQQDVLIPYLITNGIFRNMLGPEDFLVDTMLNIIGDSAAINYTPVEQTLCSNGYAYNYDAFEIPDTLFMTSLRTEAESFLKTKGTDIFTWSDSVTVVSDETFTPDGDYVKGTSNDSIFKVQFTTDYTGAFSLEFKTEPLFPRRYLMVVRTHMDFGGIYNIYVNDLLVKTFDYYDFTTLKGIIPSAVDGIRHIAVGRYCKFDFWVDNISEYGKARVRFEYTGPSSVKYNGLLLDYVECVPESQVQTITNNP